MAGYTNADVYELARGYLDDIKVPGGTHFKNNILRPYLQQASSDLLRAMRNNGCETTERELSFILPANTITVSPAAVGIPNIGQPLFLWWAQILAHSDIPLTPVPDYDPTTGFVRLQPTSLADLNTGDVVSIQRERRLEGWVNQDDWSVTVSAPYLILNGCTATIRQPGCYVGALPGKVVKRGTQWTQLGNLANGTFNYAPGITGPNPQMWNWQSGLFRFDRPSSSDVLIRVQFRLSGDGDLSAPDSTIPFDDARWFLGMWTAALAAKANSAEENYQRLGTQACGRAGDGTIQPDGNGGMLLELIRSEEQRVPPQPYRRIRTKNYGRRLAW